MKDIYNNNFEYIYNFMFYIQNHEKIKFSARKKVVFISDVANKEILNVISQKIVGFAPELQASFFCFDSSTIWQIPEQIDSSDLFLIFKDTSKNGNLNFDFHAIKDMLELNWRKSAMIVDSVKYLHEIYAADPKKMIRFNNIFIENAEKSNFIYYSDTNGSKLSIQINKNKKWTNIDGVSMPDIIPGEVATASQNIDGNINFTGTFLSLIPFALKYGCIQKNQLTFNIKNGTIVSMGGENASLLKDLEFHFEKHPNNKIIEEVGFGTNFGVTKLRGLNTAFEERHCGLHLGFGGREKGSHHLDFIFADGNIHFDEQLIYKNGYVDDFVKLAE